eukprot:494807-Rhodomonas_salina.1
MSDISRPLNVTGGSHEQRRQLGQLTGSRYGVQKPSASDPPVPGSAIRFASAPAQRDGTFHGPLRYISRRSEMPCPVHFRARRGIRARDLAITPSSIVTVPKAE